MASRVDSSLDILYEEIMSRLDRIGESPEVKKSKAFKLTSRSNDAAKKQCHHCGCKTTALIEHAIVPKDIAAKIGLRTVPKVELCPVCSRRLREWYMRNVFWVTHDGRHKARAKSLIEVAKQYQSAYQRFMENSRRRVYAETSFASDELEGAGQRVLGISL
jgi:hypothetical protein